MSENTSENSWYKYLAENKPRTTPNITQIETPSIPEQPLPSVKLFVMSFECIICFKKIMEVRMIPCQHTTCLNCVPVQCSMDCRDSFLDAIIDRPELYDKVLAGYQLRCYDLVKTVPNKKRQYPTQD